MSGRRRLRGVAVLLSALTPFLATAAAAAVEPPVGSDTNVTRSEALAIAESYRDLEWTAAAGNISAGVVDAGDGHLIRTPAWVTVGSRTSTPYKWGGFTSTGTYLTQVAANKYAGSDYTSDVSWGDAYCVGVDCSGFVSRCWRKSSKYGTSTLPSISTALSSFDDMLTGDIINLSGSHVRLFARKEENGTYTFIEAMGTYWRVMEQNYTASAISSYTPRRYDDILEIAAPDLRGLFDTAGTDLVVRWRAPAAGTADSIVIYLGTDGDSYNVVKTVAAGAESTVLTGLSASTLYYLNATFDSVGRQGLYSMDYPVRMSTGAGVDVLVVEDEARWGSHGNARFFGEALSANGYAFDVCASDAVVDGDVDLSDYWAVVWFTGRSATGVDTALTGAETTAISAYLQAGGNLFISGQEIAYALDFKALDEAFLHNYLHADYAADDAGNNVALVGTAGKPLAGVTVELDEDNGLIDDGGAYDARWPDKITVYGNGDTLCSYDVGGVGGVCVTETFPGGSAQGRMAYLAFSFECIKAASGRNDVMSKVIGYFGSPPADTAPSITVAGTAEGEPGVAFSIPLTAADDADTATGLTWSAADTDAALWDSFVIVEGETDALYLKSAGTESADTFTLTVLDSTGNSDTAAVAVVLVFSGIPDTPTIYSALNVAGDTRVTVRWEHDDAASWYAVYRAPDNFTYDTVAIVSAPAVSVMCTGQALNQRYYFKIRAYNGYDSPSASLSMTLGMRTVVESPTYLLVEDDHSVVPHDYVAKFVGALNAAGRSFDCAMSDAVVDGDVALGDYRAVVWSCGNESPALSTVERNLLKAFLDGGGRLFLSGNHIGADLNGTDPDFYERYLKCRFGADDAARYTLKCDSGVLAGLPDFYIHTDDAGSDTGTAAYKATAPDRSSLLPAETVYGGRSTLTYWNSGWVAAVDFTGGFGITEEGESGTVEAGNDVGKLVLFNFAFECVNDMDSRYAVMTRIVQYFDSPSVAGRIVLESRSDDTGAVVALTTAAGGDTRTCVTDSGGRFRFDFLDSGSYRLRVDADGFLTETGAAFAVATQQDRFDTFTLTAGDVNGDDRIDFFDAVRMKYGIHNAGGPWGDLLDLTGDGNVDPLDMEYIRTNFGRRGD